MHNIKNIIKIRNVKQDLVTTIFVVDLSLSDIVTNDFVFMYIVFGCVFKISLFLEVYFFRAHALGIIDIGLQKYFKTIRLLFAQTTFVKCLT